MASLRTLFDGNDGISGFDVEIANQARLYGQYERYYELTQSRDGIVFRSPSLTIYGKGDSCLILADEFDHEAFSISQFDIHGLVRELMDKTDYVLTYVDDDRLSESQWGTVFRGVDEYPGDEEDA